MYGYESWTIKKAEHRKIDAFELWCSRRLLRVPWTARRSNQSILKAISLEYSLERLMVKLKIQYFDHLIQRTVSWEMTLMPERLMVGGEGDDRGWDGWMASLTQWTWVWAGSGSWWWTGKPVMLKSMRSQRVGHYWATVLNRQQWFPPKIRVLGHFGMAGVITGLLVDTPRFVACSTGLSLIISGLRLPCVVWLSCFSVEASRLPSQ